MIPLGLLKAGGAALLLAGTVFAVHHNGVVKGKAERDSFWQPLFIEAEKAAAAANAKTEAIVSKANALTAEAEARHADTLKDLSDRYADSARRVRALSVQFAACSASGDQVPAVSDSTDKPDGLSPGAERAARAGDSLSDLARRCEYDARTLGALQAWIRQQQQVNP